MKQFKRVVCLLLCLAMVLALAACGKDENKGNNTAEGYVYVPTYTKVQGDFPNGVGRSIYADGKFYTMVYEYDNYETYEGGQSCPVLFRRCLKTRTAITISTACA